MFTMNVDMDNDAFCQDDGPDELARILRAVADKIERGEYHPGHSKTVLDVNGNDVGRWKIAQD